MKVVAFDPFGKREEAIKCILVTNIWRAIFWKISLVAAECCISRFFSATMSINNAPKYGIMPSVCKHTHGKVGAGTMQQKLEVEYHGYLYLLYNRNSSRSRRISYVHKLRKSKDSKCWNLLWPIGWIHLGIT